jgi:hypothetical protein
MGNITRGEAIFIAIQYLLKIQKDEGFQADSIIYLSDYDIFDSNGYINEARTYVFANNLVVEKTLEAHLNILNNIIETWKANFTEQTNDVEIITGYQYTIYAEMNINDLFFPFKKLYKKTEKGKETNYTIYSRHPKYLDYNANNIPCFNPINLYDENVKQTNLYSLISHVNEVRERLALLFTPDEMADAELGGKSTPAKNKIDVPFEFNEISPRQITRAVHNLCNGKQFDSVSEEMFYNFLTSASIYS